MAKRIDGATRNGFVRAISCGFVDRSGSNNTKQISLPIIPR